MERSLKKNQGFNGIRTRDLRDTGVMLHQLSYEATHWERGQFVDQVQEFLVSRISYYGSDGDLRENKAINRMRYVHRIGEKEHYRNITSFLNVIQTVNKVSDVLKS